jgi:hypothetical protein
MHDSRDIVEFIKIKLRPFGGTGFRNGDSPCRRIQFGYKCTLLSALCEPGGGLLMPVLGAMLTGHAQANAPGERRARGAHTRIQWGYTRQVDEHFAFGSNDNFDRSRFNDSLAMLVYLRFLLLHWMQ